MDGRSEFSQHWKRIQIATTVFMVSVLLGAIFKPSLLLLVWTIGLPIVGFLMWRLRCWRCHERLLRQGGSEIAWRRDGLWNWKPCQHKRCGAPLL